MIKAEIIADSLNSKGDRLTTFILTFPRIILSELNTHRAFSRNSASSRAIPLDRMIDRCINEPFEPLAFQKQHKGMQGTDYITDGDMHPIFKSETALHSASASWNKARSQAIEQSKSLAKAGVTKQLCNRLLEPFMYHTAIVTTSAEGLENFFKQRSPKYLVVEDNIEKYYRSKKDLIYDFPDLYAESDLFWLKNNKGQAEIHIMALAESMYDVYNESEPKKLENGEWHIPFGDNINDQRILEGGFVASNTGSIPRFIIDEIKIKIATARCARVSYLNFKGKDDYNADVKLHSQLLDDNHMSPFEHCAQNSEDIPNKNGNLAKGWVQYRKVVELEH